MVETLKIPRFTLGERLAKARKEANMTQEEMAEELDVSHSTIAKWEVNAGQPRNFMKRVKQWADLTGVPLWWLLEYDEGSNKPGSRTAKRRRVQRPGEAEWAGIDLLGIQRAS